MRFYSYVAALWLSLPILVILLYGAEWFRRDVFALMISPVILTLVASGIAVAAIVLIFTPLSFYLARRRNAILESLIDLPASVPHPVVGIGILLLFSEYTPLGSLLNQFGLTVFDNVFGLTLALITVSAPIYVRSMREAFSTIPAETFEVFSTLGVGLWRQMFFVALPEARMSIINSSLTAMSRAISEFGSVAIVSYYVLNPPFNGAKYGSVEIYDIFLYEGLQAAVVAAAVLVIIGLVISVIIRAVSLLSGSKQ
ncbi:MAG: ABC transporter permease subunit [Thermoprotei archaeon]